MTDRTTLIARLRELSMQYELPFGVEAGIDLAIDMLEADVPETNFGNILEVPHRTNDNLIAAAPDLLDALWVCMEHNRLHHGDSHNTVLQARAAIEKATGEQA